MKVNKKFVSLTVAVVFTSLLIGTVLAIGPEKNPFSEIWEAIFGLQAQIDEIECGSGSTRLVIEGTFDTTSEGDMIIVANEGNIFHWKKIDVPEITSSDMPLVTVYVKSTDRWHNEDMWTTNVDVHYDEGCVYIQYKNIIDMIGNYQEIYYITGDYTIVVVK